MRGKHVPVYDVNPYFREKSETTLPAYVYGLPLGVPDELVKQTFEKLKCNMKMVAKQRLRVNNRLTNHRPSMVYGQIHLMVSEL